MVKFYIGRNLDYTTASCLCREFEVFDKVTDVYLPMELSVNQQRGFRFITFADRASTTEAIFKIDQNRFYEQKLRVNELKPRGKRPTIFLTRQMPEE